MMVEIHQKLAQAIIDGDQGKARILAEESIEQGLDAHISIIQGVSKGIHRAGKLYASGEYLLSDLLSSADAMQAALDILEPAVEGEQNEEIIALVVLEAMENGSKPLIGTMLPDPDSDAETDKDIPHLHWLS